MRILSLQPAATEILFALGLGRHVVGVSHECTHPPEAMKLPVVVRATVDSDELTSGEIDAEVKAAAREGRPLYRLDPDLAASLKPDLVFTQDLCNVCAATPANLGGVLSRRVALHAHDLAGMFRDVGLVARACGVDASGLLKSLRARLRAVARRRPARLRPRVACIEWLDPIWTAGHWVPEMVALAGGRDVLGRAGRPSREVPWTEVRRAAPEKLLLMPCGFTIERGLQELPRLARRPGWRSLPAVRRGDVYALDGPAFFNGAGPRLVDGVETLAKAIHPAVFWAGDQPLPAMRRVRV